MIGALCSYIAGQAVQEGHSCPQHNNEFYLWTDSSIVLTWIQGPPNKWKTSVGHNVDMIQEETSSAIWRHVPTESNPDFIQQELSQRCYQHPHYVERDNTGHHRSHQAGLQRSSALLQMFGI